jgi:arginyl-tRNA synthetase
LINALVGTMVNERYSAGFSPLKSLIRNCLMRLLLLLVMLAAHRRGCQAWLATPTAQHRTFRQRNEDYSGGRACCNSLRVSVRRGLATATPLTKGTVIEWTAARVQAAMARAFGEEFGCRDAMITTATKPEFGDYQCNAALPLAKPLNCKPRDAANRLADALELDQVFLQPSIAGPGFINLKLRPEFVAAQLNHMRCDESGRLGIPRTQEPQRVVVDFSSPNIAKEMHVGHLRSTIIGDTLSRVLEFRGHNVLRLNHVGDWGTQFGMLISYLRAERPADLGKMEKSAAKALRPIGFGNNATVSSAPNLAAAAAAAAVDIDLGDLVELYKAAKKRFDDDDAFKATSREAVVSLQAGDTASLAAWSLLCEASRREFQKIYDRLGVDLEERGESFYNSFLPGIINDLETTGLVDYSEGAKVVWLDGYNSREGDDRQPLIVQKSDGGYMYSTTDLVRR